MRRQEAYSAPLKGTNASVFHQSARWHDHIVRGIMPSRRQHSYHYHELKHTKQPTLTRYPTGSYMTTPPSSLLPSVRYSTAAYGKEPCLPCGNALTFDQCLKFDHQRELRKTCAQYLSRQFYRSAWRNSCARG